MAYYRQAYELTQKAKKQKQKKTTTKKQTL